MKVSLEGPSEFQGNMMGMINQHRGMIVGSQEEDGYSSVDAEVPLSEMFGFSTVLRSGTQGGKDSQWDLHLSCRTKLCWRAADQRLPRRKKKA